MGNYNHPGICWTVSTTGQKQSRLLEQIEGNFLMHVINETIRGDSLSYLPLKETQLHNGKGSLDQSDCETGELKILRGMSRINNSVTILEFKEQILVSAGTCLAGSHGKLPGRAKGPRRAGKCSRSALSEHKNSSSHFAESQASTAEFQHR